MFIAPLQAWRRFLCFWTNRLYALVTCHGAGRSVGSLEEIVKMRKPTSELEVGNTTTHGSIMTIDRIGLNIKEARMTMVQRMRCSAGP